MSDPLVLIIGNRNYSSWSLRPWLLMQVAGIPFDEVCIPLYRADSAPSLAQWSPSGLVPALKAGDLTVWDSLAICEYLHERFPERELWPRDPAARAVARSVSAEMHAGFGALRTAMPMNCRRRLPGAGRSEASLREIERVKALWRDCRARFGHGGDMLFGRFSIADAMYAPVVLRFLTYDVPLEGGERAYADALLALPAMKAWLAAAGQESERLAQFEIAP